MKTFADYNIRIVHGGPNQQKTVCPKCSASRKKANDPCLSVDVAEGRWHCHNDGCDFRGNLAFEDFTSKWKPIETNSQPPEEKVYAFFAGRGIPKEVVDRNRITQERTFVTALGATFNCVAFNYYVGSTLVNVKYRGPQKSFQQVRGGGKAFYKINDLQNAREAIITEGEMDALAFEAAGYLNAVSVPEGAIGEHDKKVGGKLACLDNCEEAFRDIETFYLAVDNDAPGLRLREELARRLGKERCFIVEFPEGCKDANDALMQHGPESLVRAIGGAKPYPIEGIFGIEEIEEELDDLYENDFPPGAKTGFVEFDALFQLYPGQLTLVTGISSHGKSNFLDQMSVRYMVREGLTFGYFTPENDPMGTHTMRLCEQLIGKPFLKRYNGQMERWEYDRAKLFLKSRYYVIKPTDERFTLDAILGHASTLVRRYGMNAFIMDPWNTIEHQRPKNVTETEHVAVVLNRLKFFARNHGIHLFLIAHPKKVPFKWKSREYEVPTPYDVSGSAHFYNVPDNILCLYRQWNDDQRSSYNIAYVQKIKHKYIGAIGYTEFQFEMRNQRFYSRGSYVTEHVSELDSYELEERLERSALQEVVPPMAEVGAVMDDVPF